MAFPTTAAGGSIDPLNRAGEFTLDGGIWNASINLGGSAANRLRLYNPDQLSGQSSGAYNSSFTLASSFGPDCEMWCPVDSGWVNGDPVIFYLRLQTPGTAGIDGYAVGFYHGPTGTGQAKFYRVDNNSFTQLGATVTGLTVGNTDLIGAEIIGSTLAGYQKTAAGAWTQIGTRTDATYTGVGALGLEVYANLTTISDINGGTISTSQKGRPSSTITLGNWTDQGGGTTNIHQTIDEVVADDADYIRSALSPGVTADIYETKLGTLNDPLSSTGHIVRYRYKKDVTGGDTINLTVRLIQGTTTIASWTHSGIDAVTTQQQTLTGTQADSITDYTDLRLRFEVTSA